MHSFRLRSFEYPEMIQVMDFIRALSFYFLHSIYIKQDGFGYLYGRTFFFDKGCVEGDMIMSIQIGEGFFQIFPGLFFGSFLPFFVWLPEAFQ